VTRTGGDDARPERNRVRPERDRTGERLRAYRRGARPGLAGESRNERHAPEYEHDWPPPYPAPQDQRGAADGGLWPGQWRPDERRQHRDKSQDDRDDIRRHER
jgi:hypothetical protein